MNIIAGEWGKEAQKRAAYKAEISTRTISRLPFDGTLVQLIEYAHSLIPPVLVGIDAAIGFPTPSWNVLEKNELDRSFTFLDYLFNNSLPKDFFDPVTTPREWTPRRPFIRPPSGSWSLKAFHQASNNGLHRQIDTRLNAKPIFVLSGIPGSVGSGTRALWQEIIALKNSLEFHVWPFHGPLKAMMKTTVPVIAEIYPKACYGIALAEFLPARLRSIAKTKETERRKAVAELMESDWLAREMVNISDLESALINEDDFDALFSAVALMRMFLENAPLESRETIDVISEGGVLGAASLTTPANREGKARRRISRTMSKSRPIQASITYPCPIPGCAYVCQQSRRGWDAHISSLSRHPHWHPEVLQEAERKMLFKQEFQEWFNQ